MPRGTTSSDVRHLLDRDDIARGEYIYVNEDNTRFFSFENKVTLDFFLDDAIAMNNGKPLHRAYKKDCPKRIPIVYDWCEYDI